MEYGNGFGKWYHHLIIIVFMCVSVGGAPTHWFRMKVYDAATKFGLFHVSYVYHTGIFSLLLHFAVVYILCGLK